MTWKNPMRRKEKAGKYDYWSAAEDKIVEQYYPSEGRKKCLERLPGRTPKSLIHRARFLGVKVDPKVSKALRAAAAPFNQSSTAWSPAEDAVLKHLYPKGGATACLQRLPRRSRDAILQRAGRLGIGTEVEFVGKMGSAGRAGTVVDVNEEEMDGIELLDTIAARWVRGRAVPRLNSIADSVYDRADELTRGEKHV